MDFGEPNKLDFAKRLAAAVAYVGLTGSDTLANYQSVLRLVSYDNSANPPDPGRSTNGTTK